MRKQILYWSLTCVKKYFDRDKDICYHIDHASIPIRGMHVIVYSNGSTSLLRRRRIEMKKYGVNDISQEQRNHHVQESAPVRNVSVQVILRM